MTLPQPYQEALEKAKKLPPEAKQRFVDRGSALLRRKIWGDDPVAFVHDCIVFPEGQGPASYQEAVLSNLHIHRRECVRSLHGPGKTATEAWAIIHFILTRDLVSEWKVPTTAGAWGQLQHYLWPEIHKWAMRLRWDRLMREPFTRDELMLLSFKGGTGEAFARATDRPELLEGAHAEEMLYIVDEAKAVPEGVWDAVEGAFASEGEAYALATSTPSGPFGRFAQIHREPDKFLEWHRTHITLEEALEAGRVKLEWVEQRKRQWGESSSLYQTKVLGEFGGSEEDAIPLAWVEAAMDRHDALLEAGAMPEVLSHLGVDLADTGEDEAVICMRAGPIVTEFVVSSRSLRDEEDNPDWGVESGSVVGRAGNLLEKHPDCVAIVDVGGPGAPEIRELRERAGKKRVTGYVGMAPTKWQDSSGELKFRNVRSAAYYHLRELLQPPSEVALPRSDQLQADLTIPKWMPMDPQGRMNLESKDQVKKRLGRSPDRGDACVAQGTLVLTNKGSIPIEQIVPGDYVATRGGWCRVEGAGRTGTDRQVVVIEAAGRRMETTEDHPVWVSDKGWMTADTVVLGDRVLVWDDARNVLSSEESSTRDIRILPDGTRGSTTGLPAVTWALMHSIGRFGRRITVLFQRMASSITSTATRLTTTSGTWNSCQGVSTAGIITTRSMREALRTSSTWSRFGRNQRIGIAARKGGPGTVFTLESRRLAATSEYARAAASGSAQSYPRLSGARVTAGRSVPTPTNEIGTIASAQYAAEDLSPLAETALRLAQVPVDRVYASETRRDVFNLTVADHPEFFANGILVHNCAQGFWEEAQITEVVSNVEALKRMQARQRRQGQMR